jgi:hypothetical protein
LSRLFAILMGLIIWASCGGSSSTTTTTGTAAVTLSATTLTFSSAVGVASLPQSVTVTDSGTAALTFTSITPSTGFSQTNTCGTGIGEGGGCTISVTFTPTSTTTVNGSLTITDNASNSPQSVALSGTGTSVSISTNTLPFSGVAVGTTSQPESVTVNNAGTSPVAISTPTISGDFAISTSNTTCSTSLAAGANCAIAVTFSPVGSGPWNGTLIFVVAGVTENVTLTGTSTVANTVPVSVNFGPTSSYANGIYTSVTVCYPGSTTNCTTIPNVLVDTGSVGLRLLSSGAAGVTTQVGSLGLPGITDPTTSLPIYECVQYGDLSYTWGPMQMATVQVGGETASQVPTASGGTANAGIPIQVITSGTPPPDVLYESSEYANPCLVYPGTTELTNRADDDNVTNLGANGILGIGNFPQDCGSDCTESGYESGAITGQYVAYGASNGTADVEPTALADQAWNPVAAFPIDNNGVWLQLPSIPAAGQATATGTLTFGIGTEINNAIPSGATVYEVDADGNFASATFAGVTFCTSGLTTCPTTEGSGGTFLDSGSNFLYISDTATLSAGLDTTVSDCGGNYSGFFCPTSTVSVPLTVAGTNGTSSTVTLSLGNALDLFDANPSFAAFNDVGIASCVATTGSPCSPSTDSWDLGLPFFFGQPNGIFVGIYGTNTTYPNGYWAF